MKVLALLPLFLAAFAAAQTPDGGPAPTPPKPPSAAAVYEAYREHVRTKGSAVARRSLDQLVNAEDAERVDPNVVVAEHLMQMHEVLRRGAIALSNEENAAALVALQEAAQTTDPWLRSAANVLAVKALMRLERFEAAAPILHRLQYQDYAHVQDGGELLLDAGIVHAGLLQREAAVRNLRTFLESYPRAPRGQLMLAAAVLDLLARFRPDSLGEARDLMNWSRRRIGLTATGEHTQSQQKRILDLLDKLIAQAEQQQGGGGQGGAPASGMPGSGGGGGAGVNGELAGYRPGAAGDIWAKLPPKQRKEVLDQLKEQYPKRYRDMVAQYFRNLQRTGE